jgi:hypothetical protein
MSNLFETPDHDFHDVRIEQGGKRWSATWHMENGRLVVTSPWGSTSEPLAQRGDPGVRAAELLHAMIATRRGRFPVGF